MSYRENRSTGIGPISKDTVAVQFCIMLQTSESFFKLVVRLPCREPRYQRKRQQVAADLGDLVVQDQFPRLVIGTNFFLTTY